MFCPIASASEPQTICVIPFADGRYANPVQNKRFGARTDSEAHISPPHGDAALLIAEADADAQHAVAAVYEGVVDITQAHGQRSTTDLELAAQPQFEVGKGKAVGYETLVVIAPVGRLEGRRTHRRLDVEQLVEGVGIAQLDIRRVGALAVVVEVLAGERRAAGRGEQ